jgi:hypothetical protein
MMGFNSGPTWAGTALTVFGLMSTVNAFIYNETLDPWNMNKNQSECRMLVGLSRSVGSVEVGGEILIGFEHTLLFVCCGRRENCYRVHYDPA